jgi:hypothetical protein
VKDSGALQRVRVKGIVRFCVLVDGRAAREPRLPGLAEEFDLQPVLVVVASGYPGAWAFARADSPAAGGFGNEKRTASTQYRRATTEKACGGGILIMSYGGNADPNGIQVTFLDQTGSKSVKAVIAFTVPVSRIIPNIITKMNLPATSPDGQPMSYALDHKEGGRRLLENWTLVEAGIQNGDHLIVYPEVVAGCG